MANGDFVKLAVLIDADNASAAVVKELLEEVAKYGTATVKRAYGDWTTQNLAGWKDQLHRHAIQPIQQFAYTKGKNSTDAAFIIDAMDLLYAGRVDGSVSFRVTATSRGSQLASVKPVSWCTASVSERRLRRSLLLATSSFSLKC